MFVAMAMDRTGEIMQGEHQGTSEHWLDRPEAGGWFAIWLIRSIGRYGGRGVARMLLYPITLYFLVRRGV